MNIILGLTYTVGIISLFFVSQIQFIINPPSISYGYIEENTQSLSHSTTISPQPVVLTKKSTGSNGVIFVGDVLLSRNVEFLMQQHGVDYPYRGVNFSDLVINPYVFGNFEATVPKNHVSTKVHNMTFSVAEKYLSALRTAGFTHLSLANNHSYDFGEVAYFNTQKKMFDNNLIGFGNPKTLSTESVTFFSVENKEIAVIGLYALQGVSVAEINLLLNQVSLKSGFQIVYVHWGAEYRDSSDQAQQALAKVLVAAGADLIIGHHPHVVQEVELIDGVPVFYSLGNYIFDQYFSRAVQEGLVLSLRFGKNPIIYLSPVTSESTLSQPTKMDDKTYQAFLVDLAKRSDPEISKYIKAGFIPLDIKVASSVKMAMMNS